MINECWTTGRSARNIDPRTDATGGIVEQPAHAGFSQSDQVDIGVERSKEREYGYSIFRPRCYCWRRAAGNSGGGPLQKSLFVRISVDPKQLTIEQVQEILLKEKYVCDRSLATVVYLSLVMGKPLLLEGEAGVGKTEIAKVLSKVLNAKLIRLQCYEGLDANTALYEWNYPKQMLRIKLEEVEHGDKAKVETEIFSQDYLIQRPLLEAIQTDGANPPVLLIDEIDRADMEFEAFLLEVLSDFQITIPELGTVAAKHRPYVFLTSNRTREIHDALKRRCLYHWIEYPSFEKEYEIITTKFPEVEEKMAQQICAFMQKVREMNFYKRPGVAETLDWASALIALNRKNLDDKSVVETMGCVFKYREDLHHLREQVENRQLNLDTLLRVSPELVS
jgi:MoxR-like ATPase